MKILVGYMASGEAFLRLRTTIQWQHLIGGNRDNVSFVIVSNTPNNSVDNLPVLVNQQPENGSLFNLSRMRNMILDHAITNNFDGMVILEADFIVLRWWSVFPSTWAIPFAVYDHPSKVTFPEFDERTVRSRSHWTDLGSRALIPVHCVMLNRTIFHKARWDEKYEGVGFDDWDFNNQLHHGCGPFEETDMLLCHRWHPTSCASPRPENKAYYESKWGPIPPNIL